MTKSKPLSDYEREHYTIGPQVLSEMVRMRRGALSLSKTQFAKLIGVKVTTITRWEAGIFDPAVVRVINVLFGDRSAPDAVSDMWMRKALHAEQALLEVSSAIVRYRQATGRNSRHPNSIDNERVIG